MPAKRKPARRQAIEYLLTRNVEEVIERKNLESALAGGKRLRVKLGIDPTGSKIHIGRAVVLWKLREFQELGHKVVLIIGDFTAEVGDASDKLQKRPFLSPVQIRKNLKDYLPQIGKIIDLRRTEVRYNSEWLKKLNFREISRLADLFTVQQMIERRNFHDRWEKHQEIGLRELLYPIMQGYDSVAVKADVELGGTDQLFNLLAGRKIQEYYGQKPQDIMTFGMMSGLDGRKMSTSWGNVINIVDPAGEQYGKLMSMHDDMIIHYARLATDMPQAEIDAMEKELSSGANPKSVKERVAFAVVHRYHGEQAAKKAAQQWMTIFSKKDFSGDLPELHLAGRTVPAADLPIVAGVSKSKSDARRLVEQGGASVNGTTVRDPRAVVTLKPGDVLKIGKKNVFRVGT